MQTSAELKGRIQYNTRAAQNLLLEKGSAKWSINDQQRFDRHLSDAEIAQSALDAIFEATSQRGFIADRQREGVEIFLRKDSENMTDSERLKVRNTMSTTTGSQGGFSVPGLVSSDFVSLVKGYRGMREASGQITTEKGNDQTYPTSDGTSETGEQLAQNTAASNLDPSFGSAVIPTYKYGSKVFTVPMELLQDSSVDIVAMVFQRAAERVGRIQNSKFTIGTGTGEPNGVVTASAVGKTGTTGQTLTIIYDDIVDLADSVDEAHPSPVWMTSQTMRKVLRKIKDTSGRPIWVPSLTPEGRPMLLEYPVVINNDMPVPAASAKSLAFGNLKSYLIRDAQEVVLYRFDDSAFNKFGQVGFLALARAGGNLLDSGAVKLYQHSAT